MTFDFLTWILLHVHPELLERLRLLTVTRGPYYLHMTGYSTEAEIQTDRAVCIIEVVMPPLRIQP